MQTFGRSNIAIYLLLAVLIGVVGVKQLVIDRDSAREDSSKSNVKLEPKKAGSNYLTVHVAGEVRRPGVYRLKDGQRVLAAVKKAGGATDQADLSGLNLASKLADERQIVVPSKQALNQSGASTQISLNQATVEDLQQLDGVGPATAEKIIEYRDSNGGFSKLEELDQVEGIGPKRLESLKEALVL